MRLEFHSAPDDFALFRNPQSVQRRTKSAREKVRASFCLVSPNSNDNLTINANNNNSDANHIKAPTQ